MANFGGHAIPGSFFLLYGFWLTVKYVLQHYWRTNQPKGRQTLPPIFKRLDYIEGGLQIFAAFVGQFFCKYIFISCVRPLVLISLMLSCHRYYG